jgi:aspartyl-tRNA(Asn)/glutamyl-tRNA(Gln) amidotransferase subunit A
LRVDFAAGYDPADSGSVNHPAPSFAESLRSGVAGLRIAVVRSFEKKVAFRPAVSERIETALSIWRAQGAEIRDLELPSLADYWACCFVMLTAEAFAVHARDLRERFRDYGESTRTYLGIGGCSRGRITLRPRSAVASCVRRRRPQARISICS